MLTLVHGGADPASLKLRLALTELDLQFVDQQLDGMSLEQWSETHRAISPQGRVPVLIDHGQAMTDAGIALLYLAERYGPDRLVPEGPARWYAAQASNDTLDTQMLQAVNTIGWLDQAPQAVRADYLSRLSAIPDRETPAGWSAVWNDAQAHDDQRAQAQDKIGDCVRQLEPLLENRDWLVGDAFSVADISAYALMRTLPGLTPGLVNLTATPAIMKWLQRIETRPAVQRILSSAAQQPAFAPPL